MLCFGCAICRLEGKWVLLLNYQILLKFCLRSTAPFIAFHSCSLPQRPKPTLRPTSTIQTPVPNPNPPTSPVPFSLLTSFPTSSGGTTFPTNSSIQTPVPSLNSLTTPFPSTFLTPFPTLSVESIFPTNGFNGDGGIAPDSSFNCPPASFVGCTAANPNDPVDECTAVGLPCDGGNEGEFCCRDACPRNYCTAKEFVGDGGITSAPTLLNTPEPTLVPTPKPIPKPSVVSFLFSLLGVTFTVSQAKRNSQFTRSSSTTNLGTHTSPNLPMQDNSRRTRHWAHQHSRYSLYPRWSRHR